MLAAVSMPALADGGCIGVGDGFERIGLFTFGGFGDYCFDGFVTTPAATLTTMASTATATTPTTKASIRSASAIFA